MEVGPYLLPLVDDMVKAICSLLPVNEQYRLMGTNRYWLHLFRSWYPRLFPNESSRTNLQLTLDHRILLDRIEGSTDHLALELPPSFDRYRVISALALYSDRTTLVLLPRNSKQCLENYIREYQPELPKRITIASLDERSYWYHYGVVYDRLILDLERYPPRDLPHCAQRTITISSRNLSESVRVTKEDRSAQPRKIELPYSIYQGYQRERRVEGCRLSLDHGLGRCDELIRLIREKLAFSSVDEQIIIYHQSLERTEERYLTKQLTHPLKFVRYNRKEEPTSACGWYLFLDLESVAISRVHELIVRLTGWRSLSGTDPPVHFLITYLDRLRWEYRVTSFELYEQHGIPIRPDRSLNYQKMKQRMRRLGITIENGGTSLPPIDFHLLYNPRNEAIRNLWNPSTSLLASLDLDSLK